MKKLWQWFLSFFKKQRNVQPEAPKPIAPTQRGRFSGSTFKRIKKVGNFFAYGWVQTDKRYENLFLEVFK
jgi:hypothetical protein